MVSPNPAPRERSVAKRKIKADGSKATTKRVLARESTLVGDLSLRILQAEASERIFARAAKLGFSHVLAGLGDGTAAFDRPALITATKLATAQSVGLLLDIELHRVGAEWPLVQSEPAWFQRVVAGGWPVDPRRDLHAREVLPRFDHANAADGLAAAFVAQLCAAIDRGVAGFAINWPQRIPAAVLKRIIEETRRSQPSALFIAWAPGLNRSERNALVDAGFDACFCSLPWWDYRAPWFIDELADLRRCGKIVAPVASPNDQDRERVTRLFQRATATAALCADGWLLQSEPASWADTIVAQTNAAFTRTSTIAPRPISAPWSRVTAWLSVTDSGKRVTLINSNADHHASVSLGAMQANVAQHHAFAKILTNS